MPAICLIQVLTTDGAESFAFRRMQRTDREFQQSILSQQRFQVNLTIFRYQQAGFRNITPVEGIQIRDRPFKRLGIHLQATYAFEVGLRTELPLEKQSLRSSAETRPPGERVDAEIIPQGHNIVIEIKITARADRCIDQEPDIESQWTTKVSQWILLYASIGTTHILAQR